MTRIYVTQDAEGRAMWTDVAWGYNGYIARAVAAGERSYAGAAGGRLKRAAQRIADVLRRNLRVATPERVGAALALMMRLTLAPNADAKGACFCSITGEISSRPLGSVA